MASPQPLLDSCADDPWSLTAPERSTLLAACRSSQQEWLPRLQAVVEPPLPNHSVPAFLLDVCDQFAVLADGLRALEEPGVDGSEAFIRDLAQRFVDHYRNWGEVDLRDPS